MLFTGNCTSLTRWQGCILMTNYIHILINCIQWAIKYHLFLLHKNHSQLSPSLVAQHYERTNVWANTDKRRLYAARLRIVHWDLSDSQSVLCLRKNVFSGTPFSCTSQILYTIVMLWWNNWLDMWSRWAVETQHDKSSHLQDCAILLIDLKNNRQPKKPHGHAAKYFATRWRIQMGLPKTIWEKTHFAHGLVQPEDRNDICTSAGGSVAKDKERRGPCRKGSETASLSLYLLIRDAKLILTTIKLNFKQRTDRKREDIKARRRGTRCEEPAETPHTMWPCEVQQRWEVMKLNCQITSPHTFGSHLKAASDIRTLQLVGGVGAARPPRSPR